MSLNIKNEGVHAAVRTLAELLGISQTSAVEVAVREKLALLTAEDRRQRRSSRLREAATAAQVAYRGVDLRTAESALYDETSGLPR